uniref:Uncharacterized protein n=1 Tax=Glossina brevipalpis TaxID=37001 RepID=A0A1A9X0B0_9MUSC
MIRKDRKVACYNDTIAEFSNEKNQNLIHFNEYLLTQTKSAVTSRVQLPNDKLANDKSTKCSHLITESHINQVHLFTYELASNGYNATDRLYTRCSRRLWLPFLLLLFITLYYINTKWQNDVTADANDIELNERTLAELTLMVGPCSFGHIAHSVAAKETANDSSEDNGLMRKVGLLK